MTPRDHSRLIAQIKRHEGSKRNAQGLHVAYRCAAGALTIGYGHNLDANPIAGLDAGSTLKEEKALRLLEADVAAVERALTAAVPVARDLDPARYAVLVNMTYNLGLKGLLGFANTLAAMEQSNYGEAASLMMRSKWAQQVGPRARELAQQMRTGQWQA